MRQLEKKEKTMRFDAVSMPKAEGFRNFNELLENWDAVRDIASAEGLLRHLAKGRIERDRYATKELEFLMALSDHDRPKSDHSEYILARVAKEVLVERFFQVFDGPEKFSDDVRVNLAAVLQYLRPRRKERWTYGLVNLENRSHCDAKGQAQHDAIVAFAVAICTSLLSRFSRPKEYRPHAIEILEALEKLSLLIPGQRECNIYVWDEWAVFDPKSLKKLRELVRLRGYTSLDQAVLCGCKAAELLLIYRAACRAHRKNQKIAEARKQRAEAERVLAEHRAQ